MDATEAWLVWLIGYAVGLLTYPTFMLGQWIAKKVCSAAEARGWM